MTKGPDGLKEIPKIKEHDHKNLRDTIIIIIIIIL